MGWSIPTYAGTRATGQPSNYRIAMFELCRAVKERSVATANSASSLLLFKKADGTFTDSPTMEDLYLLPCVGANCAAEYNLSVIQAYIVATVNAGKWMTTVDGTTPWTVESLEAEIGASLDRPTRVNEARAWQAYQDAFDRMRYAKTTLVPTITDASYDGYSSDIATYITAQDSWDHRTDNVDGGSFYSSSPQISVWWSCITFGSLSGVRRAINGLGFGTTQTSPVSTLLGTLTNAEYSYTSNFKDTTVSSFSFKFGSDTIETTGSETATAPATPTMGTPIKANFSITTPEPSTVPFNIPPASSGWVAAKFNSLTVYHDISSAITNKAA